MKKRLTAILVITMMAIPFNAFAAEDTITSQNDSRNIDVHAKYVDGTSSPDVYSVDVTWGAMEFTYSASGVRLWNPSTHQYTDVPSSSWSASGNTVTVTNHSNRNVNTDFTYTKAPGFNDVSGAFSVDTHTLSAGVIGDVAGADSVTTILTLSGALADSVTSFTKVGSVTVTLR